MFRSERVIEMTEQERLLLEGLERGDADQALSEFVWEACRDLTVFTRATKILKDNGREALANELHTQLWHGCD